MKAGNLNHSMLCRAIRIALCLPVLATALHGSIAVAKSTHVTQSAAITVLGGTTGNRINHRTAGWEFEAHRSFRLIALGWYDHESNGLRASHDVALWVEDTREKLISVTVPKGRASTIIDSFRYAYLDKPLLLTAGNYVIGGVAISPTDPVLDFASLSTAAGITYIQNRGADPYSEFAIYPDRTMPMQEKGIIGPNFIFAPVPEPQAYALFSMGLVLLRLSRRWRTSAHPPRTLEINSLCRPKA